MPNSNELEHATPYSPEKNSHAIAQLTTAVSELTTNTHKLLDSQQEVRDCIRQVYMHNNQIEALSQTIKKLQLELQELQKKQKKIEQQQLVSQTTYEARINLFITTMRYGPILIAALMTLLNLLVNLKELHL